MPKTLTFIRKTKEKQAKRLKEAIMRGIKYGDWYEYDQIKRATQAVEIIEATHPGQD